MASVNKVIIVGALGRDPETRYMPNGDCVCNISVATSEKWVDKNSGEKKEQTEWHRVTMYRKLGEIAGQYLKKGASIYVEGKLQTRKWTDKEGVERYATEIIADSMQMLGGKQSGDNEDAPAPRQQAAKPAQKSKSAPNFDNLDDDIPF